MSKTLRMHLLASSIIATAAFSAPAFSQDASAAAPAGAAAAPDAPQTVSSTEQDAKEVVITGTLFRSSADNVASPVTVLTSDDIAKRGITTVQGAIQSLSANGGPGLTNSFSANGAFAGGAAAVTLRSLSTNSTLVLFDGLRAAYYPLADDGSRNFVDLNTIPDEIVDRVDILKDGASSTYGADAVAGVVNIITKKQITGVSGLAEAGLTQRGDAGNQRVSLTAGYGDLASQGFNVYVSGHYINQDALFNHDRGYPYNSDNQTGICYQGTCGIDNRFNSPINFAGVSGAPPIFLVRPADATNTTVVDPRYRFLNPSTGCGNLTPYNLTPTEVANFPTSPATVCTQDAQADSQEIEPKLARWGVSARATVNLGGNAQAYAEFNFEQSSTDYGGYGLAGTGNPTNSLIRTNAPNGLIYPRFSTAAAASSANAPGSAVLALPVYICPRLTIGACNATNGTLNPNNPFAAAGQVARIIGTLPDLRQDTLSRSRAFRLATGVSGAFGNGWDYRVDAVGMVNNLRRTFKGYVYIQHLLDEIKDGSYNFVNPFSNSKATLDYLAPRLDVDADSAVYQVNGSLTHNFFELPGGPVQVAVGGSIRKESVNAPSANDDYNGPTERYFVINAFGTVGSRWVESPYFEINAPILNAVTLDVSGRYDNYSTGQHAFSPKAGIVVTPMRQITLRGTVSRGFRIPSFGESSALPTTGYVPFTVASLPAAYLAQYSNPGVVCDPQHPANCSNYLSGNSLGQQSSSNPNLKPEKSRNITAGIDLKPFHGVKFSVDYYNIRKTGAITPAPFSAAVNAYYAGQAIPAGYVITPAAPDPQHPNALPLPAVVSAPYINANTIETDGFDFGAQVTFHLANGWVFDSNADVEYIHKLNTLFPDGHVEKYAGTLGNFSLTAGTGTPRWKGSWMNTVTFAEAGSLTATAYYTAGYNLSAADSGTEPCTDPTGGASGTANGLNPGFQACNVKRFIDVDLTGTINATKHFALYFNVMNLLDAKAPLDTATYGGYLYNPVVAEAGIVGRSFRVGARFKF